MLADIGTQTYFYSPAMSTSKPNPKIKTLIQQCEQESARYQAQLPHDERPCLELFRLAIVENNQQAWTAIYNQYHSLMKFWVGKHPKIGLFPDSADIFINAAFTRFWSAQSPENFHRFPGLGALLRYLQGCLHSVITDESRRRQRQIYEQLPWDDEGISTNKNQISTETTVVNQAKASALEWLVKQQARNETENIVLTLSWFYDLPPREIYAQYPRLFESVQQVYKIKRNILNRLLRNPDIKKLLRNEG